MRILQCVGDINPALGGSVEAARQLSIALDRLGQDVELVTLRRPSTEWIAGWRGEVHYAGPASTTYLYSRRLTRWIREHAGRYDGVVIHGLWRYTGVGVWRGLRKHGVPYFVFAHGMLDPYFRRAFPWKHAQKLICWLAAESRVIRGARAVLFTCEEERRRARLTFRPYACHERVVGLGIARPSGDAADEKRAFLSAWPALAGKRIVLFLGRLHSKKGCDLLIEAFAQVASAHPDLRLVIAGPDDCGSRTALAGLAARRGLLTRVLFTGPLYGDLKWGALRAAEAFALPSHSENFGIGIVEALACGVPVLISNQVNIWREIQADGAGFAADADVEGIASLFERWLTLAKGERERMCTNALRCFSKRFELEGFARGFLGCFETATTESA